MGIHALPGQVGGTLTTKQERDYSHRSLLDKLGVKPSSKTWLTGEVPAAFKAELTSRTVPIRRASPSSCLDLAFLFVRAGRDLHRLTTLKRYLGPTGAIWVVYPKGGRDPSQNDVIAAGLDAGVVDNKVVSFSDTHTGLRFVIRRTDR